MRTALAVGESGALSGRREVEVVAVLVVVAVSGPLAGGFEPPQPSMAPDARSADRTNANGMVFIM
jgi:hypothetical protein